LVKHELNSTSTSSDIEKANNQKPKIQKEIVVIDAETTKKNYTDQQIVDHVLHIINDLNEDFDPKDLIKMLSPNSKKLSFTNFVRMRCIEKLILSKI
jgi:hypothetical protein